MNTFRIGFSRADFTPAITGHAGARRPMEINTAVIEAGGTKAAIVSVDIIGIARADILDIQDHASRVTGIPAAHILVHATHTHSSPFFRDWGGTVDRERFADILTGAVETAQRIAVPARMRTASADVGKRLSVYRRDDAGGGLGYLPTAAMMDEGGYEGRSCVVGREAGARLLENLDVLVRETVTG